MSSRRLHHRAPPLALDVLLELDAERAVVPGRPGAAVDLAAGVDETPALGEGDDVVDGRRRAAWPRESTSCIGCAGWLPAKRSAYRPSAQPSSRGTCGVRRLARLDDLVGRRLVDRPATAGARRSPSRRTPTARGGSRRRSPRWWSAPTASGSSTLRPIRPSTYPGRSASAASAACDVARGTPRHLVLVDPEPVHDQHARTTRRTL